MSKLWVSLSGEVVKNDSQPWLSLLQGWGILTMKFTGKFKYMVLHLILLQVNAFGLGSIGRDGGLSTLCHSCLFACQIRVLKILLGPGYLQSEDGVVLL